MIMSASNGRIRQEPAVSSFDKHVVRITKTETVDNQQVQVIDEDAIESVFGNDDVKNCPVAIYSITGKLRTGKSFFLTLFMNYLKNKENWRRDNNAEISDGFPWRGGRTKHTEGIWVTKEPIMVKGHPKHEKVALYLMDTQGVFDPGSSDYSDSLLVSLSTVLSSYQIYNVKENLDRKELQNLKVYSDFGKDQFKETPSNQTLLFLIRDWYSEDHQPGFEGGNEYITSILNDKKASEEYKDLCENIKTSFKDVKCVLLPEPGRDISKRNENAPCATFKEVEPQFLDTLEKVFKTMIESLEVKELNGKPFFGTDIIQLAINLSKKEQEDSLNATVLMEIHAAAYLANLLGRCEDDYDKMAQEVVREFVTDQAVLEEHHKSIVKEVVERYVVDTKSYDSITNYKQKLKEILELRKCLMCHENEVAKVGVEALYRYLVEDCYETGLDVFKAEYQDYRKQKQMLSDDEVENHFKIRSKKILELFDRVPGNKKFDEAIFNSYKNLLKEKLDLQKRVFIVENHFHQAKASANSYAQVCERVLKWFSKTKQQFVESKFHKDTAMKSANDIFDKKPNASDDWWTEFTNRMKPNTEKYTNLTQEMLEIYNKGQTNKVKKEIIMVESKVRQHNKNATIQSIDAFENSMKWKSTSTAITDKDLLKSVLDNCCARLKLEVLVAQEESDSKSFLSTVEYRLKKFYLIHGYFAKNLMPKYLGESSIFLRGKLLKSDLDTIDEEITKGLRNIKNHPAALTKIVSDLRKVQEDYSSKHPEFWENQARRAKTLFIQEYNEEINWMLNRKMMVSQDIEGHFVSKLEESKRYLESNFQKTVAAKYSTELESEMSSLKCNWQKINTEHKVIFVRHFTKVENVLQRIYWAFSYLTASNVQDKVVMYKPKTWVLPEKVGDTLTKFTKLKRTEKPSSLFRSSS